MRAPPPERTAGPPGAWVWGLLTLAILLPTLASHPALASVVSRLGDVYLYDPLSFDAGVMQRGIDARGGAGTDAGSLEVGLDLPFYREFSLRTAYIHRFYLDAPDGHDLTWRLRMPVVESARYGRIASVQAVYAGSAGFGDAPDPLLADHLVGAARTIGRTTRRSAHSFHGLLLLAVRDKEKVEIPEGREGVPGGRVGVALRAAHLFQLYDPAIGPGGKWTVTLSTAELRLIHFGGRPAAGGAGRLDLVALAPAINFTPRIATYTVGVLPRVTLIWGPGGLEPSVGGLANLSITYRSHLD